MSREAWIPLIVGLLGGGAMGAIIRIFYDKRQGRIQGILKRITIFPLFEKTNAQGFDAVLKVTHGSASEEYANVFVADVTVTNSGRSDFNEFEFGVETPTAKCIHVAWENPDQHHTITLLEPVSPTLPKAGVKLRAHPFNRGDIYSFRLYLTAKQGKPEPPKITSPHSIRFVDDVPQRGRSFDAIVLTLIGLLVLTSAFLGYLTREIVSRGALPYIETSQAPADVDSELKFSTKPPLPAKFGHVWPGMKLSEVRAAIPRGALGSSTYASSVDSGPFKIVMFEFSSPSADPTIEAIRFGYRSFDAQLAVHASAFMRLRRHPHEKMGSKIVWPDINGFRLTLGSSYVIERAPPDLQPR